MPFGLHPVAKNFRKRFPERDLQLLEGVFENHCKSGGPDSFSGVFKVIVEICKSRPNEGWPIVANALENKRRVWSMKQERRTPGYTTRWEDMQVARA